MRIQGGEVEIGAVLAAVFAVEDHAARQLLHGDECFTPATQGTSGLEVRAAALIHQGIRQVGNPTFPNPAYSLPVRLEWTGGDRRSFALLIRVPRERKNGDSLRL